jgi:hypothetical protein
MLKLRMAPANGFHNGLEVVSHVGLQNLPPVFGSKDEMAPCVVGGVTGLGELHVSTLVEVVRGCSPSTNFRM